MYICTHSNSDLDLMSMVSELIAQVHGEYIAVYVGCMQGIEKYLSNLFPVLLRNTVIQNMLKVMIHTQRKAIQAKGESNHCNIIH